jgi:DNA-binding CsgD family transcriptional regulator
MSRWRDIDEPMDTNKLTGNRYLARSMSDDSKSHHVSGREVLLLRTLISQGAIPKVAAKLGLSERHTRRLLARLRETVGVNNNYALVAWAISTERIVPCRLTMAKGPD